MSSLPIIKIIGHCDVKHIMIDVIDKTINVWFESLDIYIIIRLAAILVMMFILTYRTDVIPYINFVLYNIVVYRVMGDQHAYRGPGGSIS